MSYDETKSKNDSIICDITTFLSYLEPVTPQATSLRAVTFLSQ